MGFRGNVLKLFKSYLFNRYQYVEVNGCKSQNRKVDYGVPQGSVLDPLFFILFINDITSVRCDGKELFADDGVFWIRDICFNKLILRLNNLLADLRNWLYINKLMPNTTKTVLMLFTNKKIEYLPDVYFCGDLLKWVDKIKYLGVVIDNKLCFNFHLNSVKDKISRSNGIIYRLKSSLPSSLLLNLYNSLLYPHLVQNIIVWGGVSENKLRPIQVQMNFALRNILNINYDNFHSPLLNTNSMFLKLNLLKLKEVFQYFMTKFIHSCIHGKNYFIFQEHF